MIIYNIILKNILFTKYIIFKLSILLMFYKLWFIYKILNKYIYYICI